MTRRLRTTLLGVALVLLIIFFVPQLPPVRAALLEVALGFAARSGYDVSYQTSAGNPWTGLSLKGVKVTGAGVDASLDTLSAAYTLPALLTGRLPVSAAASGARGTLDLKGFGAATAAEPEPPPAPPGRARFRITPVLRKLTVSDVALTVTGAPLGTPPIRVQQLELSGSGESLQFDAEARIRQAVAQASGQLGLEPFSLTGTIARADLALAQSLFAGAEGGFIDGTVRADGQGLEADLELHGGTVDLVGIGLSEVSGPLTWRGDTLTSELTGRALGGTLRGRATVDVGAQHWQADVRGDAQLADALVWVGQNRFSPQTVAGVLAPTGGADVVLRVGGWQTFTLAGSALGQGNLLGEPLRDLNVDFGFATDVGVKATASARLGGAPFDFALEPKGQGFSIAANGADLPLRGFLGDVAVDLESQQGELTGTTDLTLRGAALGRDATLSAAATTDGTAWRARFSGQDALGASARGNVTLRGSNLRGTADVQQLTLPGLAAPVSLSADANGPLSALPLRLAVSGPRGVRPAAGGVQADADFSGQATATLRGGSLEDVRGSFGPLELSGSLSDLRYTLTPTPLSGRASGTVALRQGRLTRSEGRLETTATLRSQNLRGPGVTLPNLNAALSATTGESPTVRLRDPAAGLDVALNGGLLRGTFAGTQLGALGETFAVDGTVSARTAALLETLELDLEAATPGAGPGTTLRASGTGSRTQLSVQSDPGATLAGRTLGSALELSGEASLRRRSADLAGTLGALEVQLDAAPDAAGALQTQAQLGSGDSAFSADFRTPQRWATEGTLPLGELGQALGLPLQGTVRSSLSRQGGRFSGSATVRGQAFGLPLTARAEGTGDALTLRADTTLLGQPLGVAGQALPTADLTAQLGQYGTLSARGPLEALQLSGSGTVPGLTRAGVTVAAQPWQLAAKLGPGRAQLKVGASRVRALRGANGWTLEGALEQAAQWRGRPLRLQSDLTLSTTPELRWQADLSGQATLPYRDLSADLQAQVSGRGSRYSGDGTLAVAGEPVALTLSGEGAQVQASAALRDIDLAPFVPPSVSGSVDGDLRLTSGDGLDFFATLETVGEAFGRPFDLSLGANRDAGVTLSGTVAGAKLAASGGWPLRRLELTVADGTQPFDLTAFVSLGERIAVQGAGGWRGDALSVFGGYTPSRGAGTLEVGLADATFQTQLSTDDRARTVTAALSAPTGLLNSALPVQADAQVTLAGPRLTVRQLEAKVGDTALTLAGAVRPRADLTGELTVPTRGIAPAANPIALRLNSLETGYLAALTQGELELRSVLGRSFRPERVRLIGDLTRRWGARDLTLTSDLVWQAGAGFAGRSDLGASLNPATQASLSLMGEGGLGVSAGASTQDVTVVALRADLSAEPWRDRRLAGTLELNAPAARLAPSWPGEPLTLAGALALSGTLTEPALTGPLTLQGALSAAGTLSADRQGAEVALAGDGLNLVGEVDPEGYRSTLTLGSLDLSALLPQLTDAASASTGPTLSAVLRAGQRWGAAPLAQLTDLRFRTGSSLVQGSARYDGTLKAGLELEANLADFSPALRGRVSGPLTIGSQTIGSQTIGSPRLGSTLELSELGPSAADWGLGGAVRLGGTLAEPEVEATLTGSGSAQGTLRAQVAPRRGTLTLRSDLELAGAETAFNLTRTTERLSASGTLRYQGFAATLAGEGQRLVLRGRDRLNGWRGVYAPAGLSLTGPLASLNPQLTGQLELASTPTLRQLRGRLVEVGAGPVSFGTLEVQETQGPGRAVRLRGETLDATVGLSAALPWRVTELNLALPGNTRVTASGQGTRQAGALAANVATAALSLPTTVSYSGATLALAAGGALPLGTLDLQARLSGGRWQGGVTVSETRTRNNTGAAPRPLLESRLAGTLSAPTLSGTLALQRSGVGATGTFSVARDAAEFSAELSSPQLEQPLRVSATGWPLTATLSTQNAPRNRLEVKVRDGHLEPSGTLALGVGPANVTLRGQEDALNVRLGVPAAPGLALRTRLPTDLSAFSALLGGLELEGVARTRGSLTLALRGAPEASASGISAPWLSAANLQWRGPAGTLLLNGSSTLSSRPQGTFSGRWQGGAEAALPWLRSAAVPFTLRADGQRYILRSDGNLGTLSASYDVGAAEATLMSDLTLGRGKLEAKLRYNQTEGPSGTAVVRSLPVFSIGDETATLASDLELSPSGVSGSGSLTLAGGQADLSGQAGWRRLVPASLQRLVPAGGSTLAAQVRLNRFELGSLPPLEARVPYLTAPLSGVATLSGTQIVGQVIAPDLRVLTTPLPTQIDFNGSLQALQARATFGDSRLNLTYSRAATGGQLAGLVTLETFPLQILAEAAAGPSQVSAAATGAARFDLALGDLRRSYVRLATERLTLQNVGSTVTTADVTRAGSGGADAAATGSGGAAQSPATQGDVSLRFENGSLYVERAEFRGDGFWQAQGILTPAELDFTFDARDADFTPLLRLVPQLATFGVGAQGSLSVRASGSAADPNISLTSPSLEVSVAGSRYRAQAVQAALEGGDFRLDSNVIGVAPLTGTLKLVGDGQIGLNPVTTRDLEFRFSGEAAVPTIGDISNIRGRIYPSVSGWRLDSRAALGNPFTVSGRLSPLDLRLRGTDLNLRAPRYFLASSAANLNLRLRAEAGIFDVSGSGFASGAQLSLDRSAPATGAETDTAAQQPAQGATQSLSEAASSGGAAEVTLPAAAASQDQLLQDQVPDAAAAIAQAISRTTVNPVLARIRFDDLQLRAPRQILFESGFGSAELGIDVTLSGSAAKPQLAGQAQTLQGNISFAGQDFTVERAVATFDPAQGAYPTLALTAQASFEKTRALGSLAAEDRYSLIDPPGSSFNVQLSVGGSFQEGTGGRRALNLEPTLSSDATLQENGVGNPRPLTETELLTLLSLGRLQLDAPLNGPDSLAGTVANTALDTAVDLFLVSELQDALSEILGVDFEIRTSAFSTVLSPEPQEFGVSVRVGGYLSENLFASVQVGRFDDPNQAYALTNEFSLRYTAAPLELNLNGGVSLDKYTFSAVTDFSLGLSYALTQRISLDANLATADSGQQTSIGFGVSFIW